MAGALATHAMKREGSLVEQGHGTCFEGPIFFDLRNIV
jgi:hypothetical protein